MIRKIARLFVIKTRFEAMAVIYALAVGAVHRGLHYVTVYPGWFGYLLLAACTAAVFMAGARLMEITRPDTGVRRRKSDLPFGTPPARAG
jgi:predicted DNA-binding transcriptional regulator